MKEHVPPNPTTNHIATSHICHGFSSMPDSIPTIASLDLTGLQSIWYMILEGTTAKIIVVPDFPAKLQCCA